MNEWPDILLLVFYPFAYELSLILIRLFSNVEDQTAWHSFYDLPVQLLFLCFFLFITMSSPVYNRLISFQHILFPKERRCFKWFPYLVHSVTYTHCLNCYLMKTSINHKLFFIACNEHNLNWRSAFAFTYIHLSIIFHSLFQSDNAWPSTTLNRFLHVFIGYDRHILFFF